MTDIPAHPNDVEKVAILRADRRSQLVLEGPLRARGPHEPQRLQLHLAQPKAGLELRIKQAQRRVLKVV